MNDSQVDGNVLVIVGASSLDNGLITTDGNGNINLPGSLTVSAFFGSSIQTALNTLGSNSGTIILPSGDYVVSSTISKSLAANQHIILQGQGNARLVSTVAEPAGEDGIIRITGDSGATARLTIRNLRISHTNSGLGLLDGIFIQPLNYGAGGTQSLANLEMDNVRITGASKFGTRVLGALGGLITNCQMSSNKDSGLALTGCINVIVLGGDYSSNVTGNLTGDYGITIASSAFLPYSQNILIAGVQANNNGRKGLDCHHGHRIYFLVNTCVGNGYNGIYAVMEDSTKDVGDITIIGNTIDMTGANNTLAAYPINVGTSGTTGALNPGSFIVHDNIIENADQGTTASSGILISVATSGVAPNKISIKNNTFKNGAGSGGYGIYSPNNLAIPYVEICENIFHAASVGECVIIQNATDVLVANNIFRVDSGTVTKGIDIVSTANAVIEGNQLNGAATYTTLIPAASATQIIRNNTNNGTEIANSSLVAPFTVAGGLTVDSKGHLLALNSGTPTLTAVNANISSSSVVGNDVRGAITFSVGTLITAGSALFTLNYAQTYAARPYILLQNDSNQTTGTFYSTGDAAGTVVIRNSAALAVLSNFVVVYFVLG